VVGGAVAAVDGATVELAQSSNSDVLAEVDVASDGSCCAKKGQFELARGGGFGAEQDSPARM
jgi:hypothetical protein